MHKTGQFYSALDLDGQKSIWQYRGILRQTVHFDSVVFAFQHFLCFNSVFFDIELHIPRQSLDKTLRHPLNYHIQISIWRIYNIFIFAISQGFKHCNLYRRSIEIPIEGIVLLSYRKKWLLLLCLF